MFSNVLVKHKAWVRVCIESLSSWYSLMVCSVNDKKESKAVLFKQKVGWGIVSGRNMYDSRA